MSRATILQTAVLSIIAGVVLILTGVGDAGGHPPAPVYQRPATQLEESQREIDRLYEHLLYQQESVPLTDQRQTAVRD